jgi:trans-aconitate 2-methyltransferase
VSDPVWDPDRYGRFAAERAQPFHDLVALIARDRPIDRVVDLGCGTGALTAALVAELGAGAVTGVDISPRMLARCAAHAGPRLRFAHADLATWTSGGDHDVVLANASLHWVPDHPTVLGRWTDALAPGGQLVVQVPANADHPSHRASVAVAEREPFRSALGGVVPADPVAVNVLRPEEYAVLLRDLGYVDEHVRLQVYVHELDSTDDVVEWVRGSSLTRFTAILPPEAHEPFVEAYRRELHERIGRRAPYPYTFKRILMWGRRPG